MKKYYNFDTRFISLRDALRAYLHENASYYELSGNYSYYHFEILVDLLELEKVNAFLDTQIIKEVI
jgi:hypothetical protein